MFSKEELEETFSEIMEIEAGADIPRMNCAALLQIAYQLGELNELLYNMCNEHHSGALALRVHARTEDPNNPLSDSGT